MIKETDKDSYEKLRSLNQNLTFDYTEQIFKENNLVFGLSQKKTLGLIGEDDLFTNLALLLSEQCNHTLKVAVFEGIEKNIFKDRKEFKGSLLKQVTEAFEFINLVNKTEATFEGLIRNGFSNIRLAEKDSYEINNYRQLYMTTETIGSQKAEVAKSRALEINPYTDIQIFDKLSGSNARVFFQNATVIVQYLRTITVAF